MASSQSPVKSKQDIISSLPTEITDKIMKRLPLKVAAKTSVLSRNWRLNWLSLRFLVFDETFWKKQCDEENYDWQKMSDIINNILFHHNGTIHKFHLYIPRGSQMWDINLSRWLSFLSKTGVKKIIFYTLHQFAQMPSYIFACKELVKLSIYNCILKIPPPDFKGFAHLQTLVMFQINHSNNDVITTLIASCPRLTELKLLSIYGLNPIIDVPSLENLTIQSANLRGLTFKNLYRLRRFSLFVYSIDIRVKKDIFDAIEILASSSELQYLHFEGFTCKFLAANYTISPRTLTSKFNHLQELCLTGLKNLDDFNLFCFTFDMLQCCPFIKKFKLSVKTLANSTAEHSSKYKYDVCFILEHLVRVEIEGITGSCAELKLIEYVLSVSVVLEVLLLKFTKTASEVEVLRELLRLPRASTKAKLICLQQ